MKAPHASIVSGYNILLCFLSFSSSVYVHILIVYIGEECV